MQLAIDTSTDTASVALFWDGEVLAELTWHSRQNHSTELLPKIIHLLNGTGIQAVSSIIVARGPGSFNGLRVGLSTAKGLAYSLGIPIVGIGTLEADAYQHAETGLPICPLQNAGRGEIAAATYRMTDDGWHQLTAEHITTVATLCSQTAVKTMFCGEFLPQVATEIRSHLGEKAALPTPAARLRRAGFLAELGQRRLAAGDCDNPATLQPIYLRRPPITQPKKPLNRNAFQTTDKQDSNF